MKPGQHLVVDTAIAVPNRAVVVLRAPAELAIQEDSAAVVGGAAPIFLWLEVRLAVEIVQAVDPLLDELRQHRPGKHRDRRRYRRARRVGPRFLDGLGPTPAANFTAWQAEVSVISRSLQATAALRRPGTVTAGRHLKPGRAKR